MNLTDEEMMMKSHSRIIVVFCVSLLITTILGTNPVSAELLADFTNGLPRGWKAEGNVFGGKKQVSSWEAKRDSYFAIQRSVPGVILSPEFKLEKPFLNVRVRGDKLNGELAFILILPDGGKRIIRQSLQSKLQIPGWLQDGWFRFDVEEYKGERFFFQLSDCHALDQINIETIEASDAPQGGIHSDVYVEAIEKVLEADRAKADADPFRPILHTHAPSGKTWDANGLVYKGGLYHFFYLLRPNGAPAVQGHKVSSDLVNWEERPIAIVPTVEAGEDGIWSGSAVIDDDGRCHIFYSGVGPDRSSVFSHRQGHAISIDPDFNRFKKVDVSMITMDDIPVQAQQVRDPCVFWHEGSWYLSLTGRLLRKGYEELDDSRDRWPRKSSQGAVFLFASKNLNTWDYLGIPLLSQDKPLWEVSDFIQHGDIWIFSPGGPEYHVGKSAPHQQSFAQSVLKAEQHLESSTRFVL